jgi:hypothetical protein
MFRSILGFAIFAVVVWIALKIVFALIGGLAGILMSVLTFAAIGFAFYIVLRVISPSTADKIRDTIKGRA